jgi:hypothetical protein
MPAIDWHEMAQTDTSHGGKKERRIEVFVGQLLCHNTVESAAAAAKISLRTGWRYLQDPTVLSRLREASRESMRQAKMLVQVGSTEAAEALRAILHHPETQAVQVSAARVLIETALRTIELDELEQRITALEELAKSRWKGETDAGKNQAQARPAGTSNGHP